MKGLAITLRGIEDIAINEIKEILKIKAEKITDGRIVFDIKKEGELAKLIYLSRSIIKVLLLYDYFEFKTKEEIYSRIKKIKFGFLKDSFAVKCSRTGEHVFSSQELEPEIGSIILEQKKLKVDLTNPTTTVYLDIIGNMCFVGIDFSGELLSKRDYKVKTLNITLNSCLAFSLVKIAEWNEKEELLDPFCGSGEILIEAALFALDISPHYYRKDKFPFLKLIKFSFVKLDKTKKKKLKLYGFDKQLHNTQSCNINSKIAKVNKEIKFARYDLDWIDTKLNENSIDKIITQIPAPSKLLSEKDAEKIYREFFNQLNFILKKSGSITIITTKPELFISIAQKNNFNIINERSVFVGDTCYKIISCELPIT